MTTPASPNSISFTQITNEFGGLKTNSNQTGIDLGAYRVLETINGIDYRLDEGVPFIGQISFDDLRNKSLNVVVDINGGTRVWGRDPWNSNNTIVIGGGTRKEGGSRIIIHVRGTVQSERGTHPIGNSGSGNRWSAALRTGTWTNIVSLDVIVGPGNNNGHIRGGGGNGGNGGTSNGNDENDEQADGADGHHGTSALGLNHNIRNLEVKSGSTIIAGGGGGAWTPNCGVRLRPSGFAEENPSRWTAFLSAGAAEVNSAFPEAAALLRLCSRSFLKRWAISLAVLAAVFAASEIFFRSASSSSGVSFFFGFHFAAAFVAAGPRWC